MTKKEIINKLYNLPKGGITKKKIKGNNDKEYEYFFFQWRENGKQKSRLLKEEEVGVLSEKLDERRVLEEKLTLNDFDDLDISDLSMHIMVGSELLEFVNPIIGLKKRNGYKIINDYIYGNEYNKVFILYGLRRTGKTTLIKQIIKNMNKDDFDKTAFIQVTINDTLAILNEDLKILKDYGYKYVFIDEVTMLADFIEGASLLSDIYASVGMKIVLTGTDSLGFFITKTNELYDRCILLHTTFIPYKEFSLVLGINGIDNYIKYGGTMSLSGVHYNDSIFGSKEKTDEYIDSAIASNIQHSLKFYQYGGHFRHLYSLYEAHELTSAINRILEDINHRFTIEVLEREFKSNDLRISQNNLRKDKYNPTTVLDDINVSLFTKKLKERLEILNKDEQHVKIDEEHALEILEYLKALDLVEEINELYINKGNSNRKRIVFTQPGLRYSQAKSFIESLKEDEYFYSIEANERKRIIDRILNEISGRMIEDVILLETKIANPNKNVFKLLFADGEFDMVINDPETLENEIYEIKYSKEKSKEQIRHLIDKEKISSTEFHYGSITKKAVLYRGEKGILDDIEYINIEEYLLNL